jgi:hypothetical protein
MRRDPCAVSYEPMSQSDHQKNNRCRRRRAIRTLEALILSFAALFLQFGCAEEPTPFHVEEVTPADNLLRRNEEIRIRFSEPIETPCPVSALVSLHDASDHELPAEVSISHDTVVLSPVAGTTWPKTESFRLEVRKGHGAALRSRHGSPLHHASTYRFRASDHQRRRGRPA